MNLKDLPPLGTHMPEHGGIFAGIAGGKDGTPYNAMILLDAKPSKKLNWADACAWGESMGDDSHIPTRDESREALDAELLQWWNSGCENIDNLRPIVDKFEAYGYKQALEQLEAERKQVAETIKRLESGDLKP